jgi:hypothetical protein
MEKYKRIKFLSEGLTGKVYLVSKGSEKYAMKIEYIHFLNGLILLFIEMNITWKCLQMEKLYITGLNMDNIKNIDIMD